MKSLHGGCRKFLLLFGRIGPLALRPCALLPRVFLLPHSKNILQIPWWYGDMVCLALALAPSCAALHFWCLYIMLSKSYLPRRCDWKDGFFYESPHILGCLDSLNILYLLRPSQVSSHLCLVNLMDLSAPWHFIARVPCLRDKHIHGFHFFMQRVRFGVVGFMMRQKSCITSMTLGLRHFGTCNVRSAFSNATFA